MILNLKSQTITSAPVSPARGVSGLLSRASSITGSVTNTVQQIARGVSTTSSQVITSVIAKDRQKILLIIDDHLIDWSKYFRARRLIGDWDVKVEQAEFKDINLSANTENGTIVSIYTTDRNGYRIARTFRPDFLLIRQHLIQLGQQQDLYPSIQTNQNFSNIIIGLKYGLIPSINSLQSFYNFQDKAWVFANLLTIQRRLAKSENQFPLIEQTFYQTFRDSGGVPKLPCVVKIGSSSCGLGKVKIETIDQYQDIRSILMITNTYCTIEPFIDAKCDFMIQKIGTNYKAFTRKSVSGNWKANIGASVLEQMPMNERYRKWIDDVSDTFGGLDICSLEGVISKDNNKEYILKVHGSDMTLFGETQEEDRKNIVELIIQKMNAICKNILIKQQSRTSIPNTEMEQNFDSIGKRSSVTSMPPSQQAPLPPPLQPQPVSSAAVSHAPSIGKIERKTSKDQPPIPNRPPPLPRQPVPNLQSQPGTVTKSPVPPPKPPPPPLPKLANKSSNISNNSVTITDNPTNPFASSYMDSITTSTTSSSTGADESSSIGTGTVKQPPPLNKKDSQSTIDDIKEEVDDTMKNLRKTFAGIFGDM